jgi:hypothetical protein
MAAAQDKLEEQQVQEETAKMANSGILNDREALRGLAATGSVVQRRAAINRLVQTSDDEGMRKIRSDSMASTDNRVRDMWSKVQSSKELNDAFKDSAPDILRGEGAFGKGMTTAGIPEGYREGGGARRRGRRGLIRDRAVRDCPLPQLRKRVRISYSPSFGRLKGGILCVII